MSSALRSLLLFTAGYIAMFAIGYGTLLIAPSTPLLPADAFDSVLLPNTVGVFPEPRDMFLFAVISIFVPFVLAVLAAVAKKFSWPSDNPVLMFWAILLIAITTLTASGFASQLGHLLSARHVLAVLLSVAAVYALASLNLKTLQTLLPSGLLGLFALASALVLSQRVWTEGSLIYTGPISSHYDAVTSSIVRISTGSTCLSEVIAQYGCYGEYISPLLKMFGTDITVVTIVFAILLIAAIGFAMRFSALLIKNPLLSFGCCFSIVIATALNLVYYVNDPVLQYYPLRFLFPSASLLLAAWFQKDPNKTRAVALGLFAGAGLTWNLETGLAVLIALGGFVSIGNFTASSWLQWPDRMAALKRSVVYLLGAFAFIAIFIGYLSIKSNSIVDLSNYIIFQQVFSMTGFGMIPIPPPPDLWTIHASLLFAILVFCTLRACSHEQRDTGLELTAYLAILSIGLFVYYVGRSHPLVLRLVAWPSIILFFFLLDRTVRSSKSRLAASAASIATIAAVAFPTGFLFASAPSVIDVTEKQGTHRATATPPC